MAQNVTKLLDTFREVFSGVSTFRYKKGDITKSQLLTTTWDYELPVLTDGLSFSQAEPSTQNVKILGETKPWSTTSEAGDITLSISMPTVADEVMDLLYTKTASTVKTKTETIAAQGSTNGYFQGNGYTLTKKKVEGTAMLINEAGTKALLIRHLSGYASFEYSDPSAQPFAVKLVSTISAELASSGDTDDFDVAFLDWVAAGE